jgi:hypothetical protein
MKIKFSKLRSLIAEVLTSDLKGKDAERAENVEKSMTDVQYSSIARRIVDLYDAALETNWSRAIDNQINAMKATNGVSLSKEKLQAAVDDEISLRQELFFGKGLSSDE